MIRSFAHSIFFLSISCILLPSCQEKPQQEISLTTIDGDSSETAAGVVLGACKPIELKGRVFEAGAPKVVKAGNPEVVPGFNNIHLLGTLKVVQDVKGIDVNDSIKPVSATVTPTQVPCRQPRTVVALAPGMREQNPIGFKFFDIQQGLSSSYIASMLQDQNGNIWFGTKGGGVCKYDGSDFMHYTEKQGLPNNFVVSMTQDRYGNLWFGTDGGGVCKYDGEFFTIYDEKNGLLNNAVWSLLADSKGNVWVGSAGGGVSKFDGQVFTGFNKDNGFPSNYIISLAEDKQGNIWMGTYGEGLIKYNPNAGVGKNFMLYGEDEGLSSGIVTSIAEDRGGNLWLATDGGGVCKFDGRNFTHYTENAGLTSNSVNAVIEDKTGNMWFGTNGRGVCKYDGSNFTCFTEAEGLSSNSILCLLQDDNGELWFGTEGHGVTKYGKSCFTHFTRKEGLSNNAVYKTIEDHNKNLWFATNSGGACRYDGKNFYIYTDKEGLNNNRIRTIYEDDDHNLWFGTNGDGVSKFDGTNFYQYTEAQGLSGNVVYSILQDCNKNYWFATNSGGVCYFDGKKFIHYTKEEGFSSDIVYSMIGDAGGNIWFATDGGGAVKFDGKAFTTYTKKEGLASNVIYSILEDRDHNLWFGTDEAGVCKFDGKKFETYTEKDGLSNNRVWSILQDMRGYIWLGTENGLTRMTLSKSQNAPVFSIYDLTDGFLGNDALQNSVFQDSKGLIWWGTGKMLTRYDPSQDVVDDKAPVMHLKNIRIHFDEIPWRELSGKENKGKYSGVRFEGIGKWYPIPEKLSLPYSHNHLTFDYVGINYRSQNKIQYRYMLEGLEDKWTPGTNKTEAVYGNLPSGNFTFKVKAINKDGVWSEAFAYGFTIRPPWWQTWWFRILAALLVVTGAVAFYRIRTAAMRRRQQELEETVKERTAEVVHQKELVEEKQKEIVDSINYAKRIQLSILPPAAEMKEALGDHFVLYKPKDIVSGDFYWMARVNANEGARTVVAAVDCTGHGVPGALMSIVSNTLMNQTIKNPYINSPAEALTFLNHELPKNLKVQNKGEIIRDGMDLVMCSFDFAARKIEFAGANNALYIVSQATDGAKIAELKGDKQPISGSTDDEKKPFTNHTRQLQKGDVVYLFTDGYADQFGGPRGKKFKYKQLEETLRTIAHLPMEEQKRILDEKFEHWKGKLEQVDDVTVIGVRV